MLNRAQPGRQLQNKIFVPAVSLPVLERFDHRDDYQHWMAHPRQPVVVGAATLNFVNPPDVRRSLPFMWIAD